LCWILLASMLLTPPLAACVAAPLATRGSIAGAIRVGSESLPVVRICALPLDGSAATCVRTRAGDNQYRIDGLAAGRYQVAGWPLSSKVALIASTLGIQCIRAPCPDYLRKIDLKPGAQVIDVDLDVPYGVEPEDLPAAPPDSL